MKKTILYYDWNGDVCRTSGDIFSGYAERFIEGKGWEPCHFFNLQNEAVVISAQEAEDWLRKITAPNVLANIAFRKVP